MCLFVFVGGKYDQNFHFYHLLIPVNVAVKVHLFEVQHKIGTSFLDWYRPLIVSREV